MAALNQHEVFTRAGIDLQQLPVLVWERPLKVHPSEMKSPIMTYNNDEGNHLLLKIKGYGDTVITTFKKDPAVRDIKGTIDLFLGDNSMPNRILVVFSDDIIAVAYNYYHDHNGHIGSTIMACDSCPIISNRMHTDWILNLLQGNDPLFKISVD